MPKLEATAELLEELSQHVYMGRIKTLKVLRYKSGANAGKLFAEYSLKDEPVFEHHTVEKRSLVSDVLKRASNALKDGRKIEMLVHKRSQTNEEYSHMLAVKQVKE